MCHWCTQRNWMNKISENIRLADWDVSNTRSSSIPLNITIKTNKNTIFFNTLPEVLPVENLKNIHPLIKSLILVKNVSRAIISRKIKTLQKKLKKYHLQIKIYCQWQRATGYHYKVGQYSRKYQGKFFSQKIGFYRIRRFRKLWKRVQSKKHHRLQISS